MSPPNPYPMIAFPPSQILGAQIAARPSLPLSPRSPTLRRSTAAYYYTSAADLPSPLLTPPAPSLYDVLGVANEATPQEIRSAYRCLARTCHPDTAAAGRGGASADEFMRIHAAYTTLSDPGARAGYSRKLMGIHRHRHSANQSGAVRQRVRWPIVGDGSVLVAPEWDPITCDPIGSDFNWLYAASCVSVRRTGSSGGYD